PSPTRRSSDLTPPRGAHRPPDRGGSRLLLLRNERPHPDHLGVLAGRRRVVLFPDVPAERRAHHFAVRNDRRRRRGRTCPRRCRGWPLNETRAHHGGMWRARRGPRVDPVLPRRRARLCFLLPVPGAGGTVGGWAREGAGSISDRIVSLVTATQRRRNASRTPPRGDGAPAGAPRPVTGNAI